MEPHVPFFQSVCFKGALRFEVRDPRSSPCLEETSSKIHPFDAGVYRKVPKKAREEGRMDQPAAWPRELVKYMGLLCPHPSGR